MCADVLVFVCTTPLLLGTELNVHLRADDDADNEDDDEPFESDDVDDEADELDVVAAAAVTAA